MLVWLNGKFVPRESAMVSVFDAGFQHGVGLFETLTAHHGAAFRPQAHMSRLAQSARDLLLSDRLRIDPLVEAIDQVLQRNELQAARIRLSITGGDLNTLQATGRSQVDPTILIVAQPPTPYPDAFFEHGVTVIVAEGRDNPFNPMAGHKTLNYWPRIQALQRAAAKGAAEALWLDVSNRLSAGSVSNIFLVKDGALWTPTARGEQEVDAPSPPVLPGITRMVIIELAEALNIQVQRKTLDADELVQADEVFLTNSSWGVLPVVEVVGKQIGDGKVGPITNRLRQAWLDVIDQETRLSSLGE